MLHIIIQTIGSVSELLKANLDKWKFEEGKRRQARTLTHIKEIAGVLFHPQRLLRSTLSGSLIAIKHTIY